MDTVQAGSFAKESLLVQPKGWERRTGPPGGPERTLELPPYSCPPAGEFCSLTSPRLPTQGSKAGLGPGSSAPQDPTCPGPITRHHPGNQPETKVSCHTPQGPSASTLQPTRAICTQLVLSLQNLNAHAMPPTLLQTEWKGNFGPQGSLGSGWACPGCQET